MKRDDIVIVFLFWKEKRKASYDFPFIRSIYLLLQVLLFPLQFLHLAHLVREQVFP